jgi:hypothetical protein
VWAIQALLGLNVLAHGLVPYDQAPVSGDEHIDVGIMEALVAGEYFIPLFVAGGVRQDIKSWTFGKILFGLGYDLADGFMKGVACR